MGNQWPGQDPALPICHSAALDSLQQHGLRVFWISGRRDLSYWDYLARLLRRWDDIERVIVQRGTGPWFVTINENNIVEIPV